MLLELDAQIEDAKGKQAQLGEAKLLGEVNDETEAISKPSMLRSRRPRPGWPTSTPPSV